MSGEPEVLVVDDEPAVRSSLERALRLSGYVVRTAADGLAALEQVRVSEPDVVVLDRMLPSLDGLAVARRLRDEGRTVPVLLLTARDAVEDRVAGLDAGADDYLVKPFALDELLARLRALLRRAAPAADDDGVLRVADLELDPARARATRGGRDLGLTPTEWQVLEVFLRSPGRVLSQAQVLERVWGFGGGGSSNPVEVYVGYLRRKTEAAGEPRLLHTVRGFGHVLREDP